MEDEKLRENDIPNFIFGDVNHCTYCGVTPTCVDHVIPVSQFSDKKRSGSKFSSTGIRTYCCHQCNSFLSDKYFPTFNERVLHIRGKLIAKSQPSSRCAVWSDEEIAKLDHTLRTYVANKQYKIARDAELPVILHVRRSQDVILKALRRRKIPGGIAHAFNGSFQQAEQFIDLGFKLGFGGAATYERALQIRRLLTELPLDSIVTETDAPDIPPAWLREEGLAFNEPAFLPRIAKTLASIRGVNEVDFALAVWRNAMQVLPRWSALCADLPNLNLVP